MEEKVRRYIKEKNPRTADDVFRVFRGRIRRDEVREIFSEETKGIVASEELVQLREIVETIHKLDKGLSIHKIEGEAPKDGKTEGSAVMVASDWHIEEEVKDEWVNGLNHYNLEESRRRADLFFRNGLKLTKMFGKDLEINNIVLALLGDFFSNDIHDELTEINLLKPMEACLRAQEYIASGIQFLLDHSTYNLTIVCASGNHARTTDETYFSTEAGHSLEYYMYRNLEQHFSNRSRVKFIVKPSYHHYVEVLGYRIRFHHGHAIRYGGGVGGLFVPAYKKIDKWNNAMRSDLDVFGHHHQYKDGGSFVSNGSMIGYNVYALRNGFAFERPQQAYFIVDRKRGKTISAPILFQ